MRHTDDPIGPEANASALRRLSLRLRALKGRPPWERPLRKMHENIFCSNLLIHTARFLIDSSRRLIASRPLWKAEQLAKAARRLTRATDHIHRAAYAMQEANAALAGAPESDSAAAERLAADTKRMLQLAAILSMVAMQLDVAVANAAVADAVLLERSGHVADERPAITAPPPVIRPFQDDSPRLPLRRLGSVLGTIEDAIRRVCRGRAPPMVSLCPL